jgi:methionyl-tRNA formyltransferase
MRVIFFGTPEFAVPSLTALAGCGLEVTAVVTQPDRARGRGLKKIEPPPVAVAARKLGLRIFQPDKPTEPVFLEQVGKMNPDVFAVAAYGNILPDRLLALAPKGAWNVHPSLLPLWRGPAPIHRAMLSGDPATGVSIMRLTGRMDAGPVARQETTMIGPAETRGELERRLAILGAGMLAETITALERDAVVLVEQDEEKTSYAAIFKPGEGELKWSEPASHLDRLIRTLLPAPGAFFRHGSARVKVTGPGTVDGPTENDPGVLVERNDSGGWRIAAGSDSLWIMEVQPEGGKSMTLDAFVSGRRLSRGSILRGSILG